MAIEVLRDLRGLRVQVIHPPDAEGQGLVEQFHRIGCLTETQWPVPDDFSPTADVAVLAIEYEARDQIRKLTKHRGGQIQPTIIAIVGYEDPSTLQIVLESGALAIVERPIRPFGLLSNLTVARSLWLQRMEAEKRARKLERRLSGMQQVQKAKSILMNSQGITEDEAYGMLRKQAMAKRMAMEDLAAAIINANDVLGGVNGLDKPARSKTRLRPAEDDA
ncbi:ANTAR domain-containing response regulator [Amorphus orientalis]|uniref:AmiR/NasT family two-component response regulator n=1 Tax=Amorphus orientalis TaxID=649198 RepID=A0AAE4AUD3_9HYPH|nr:ANTAR domain-containing protein [Amorphus orientalis]MDQ0315764.1 AmiR/NasT family two-component response regulator [Amorphus orientalis]